MKGLTKTMQPGTDLGTGVKIKSYTALCCGSEHDAMWKKCNRE